MNIVEKMFPNVDKNIEQISENRYRAEIQKNNIKITGEITIEGNQMYFDINRIKVSNEEYIVTKQFYRRPNTDSILRVNDVIIVTNLTVETPTRTTNHTTNYRVNLDYLFSLPVRSLVTPNRSVYSDISFFRILKYPAYITLETKNEKYADTIIEDIEKAIFMYTITRDKITLEYYDVLKPIEIESNVNATVPGRGILQKVYKIIKQIIRR